MPFDYLGIWLLQSHDSFLQIFNSETERKGSQGEGTEEGQEGGEVTGLIGFDGNALSVWIG